MIVTRSQLVSINEFTFTPIQNVNIPRFYNHRRTLSASIFFYPFGFLFEQRTKP
jgi:hypothetical protein